MRLLRISRCIVVLALGLSVTMAASMPCEMGKTILGIYGGTVCCDYTTCEYESADCPTSAGCTGQYLGTLVGTIQVGTRIYIAGTLEDGNTCEGEGMLCGGYKDGECKTNCEKR